MAERPANRVEQAVEQKLFRLDGDGSGFDLRQVENVADQVQQVGARPMDGARELGLLRGEISVRVVGELLAEDQNAV